MPKYEPYPVFHPFLKWMRANKIPMYKVMEEFGITRQTFHNYMTYKREPTLTRAVQLCVYADGHCKVTDFIAFARLDRPLWEAYLAGKKIKIKKVENDDGELL